MCFNQNVTNKGVNIMKIKSNYQQQKFGHAFIDIRSLNNFYKASPIIKALKEQNTPLRKFIKEVINTKKFEDNIGDCFIKFNQKYYRTNDRFTFRNFDLYNFCFLKSRNKQEKPCFLNLII